MDILKSKGALVTSARAGIGNVTVAIDRKSVHRGEALNAAAMAQLFTEARTHHAFRDLPVSDALLRKALDLAKMGPTSANQQPLLPHVDAKSWFAGNPDFAARSAAQNGTLQVAYFILALRAVGMDAGPMTGFDPAKVEEEFFPDGKIRANVIINIGYGDDAKLFPRSPRFSFDQMATIL